MQASLDSLLCDKKYQELLMNQTRWVEKATKLSQNTERTATLENLVASITGISSI